MRHKKPIVSGLALSVFKNTKNIIKKFAYIEKMPLLCTRFRGENESKSWLEVFEKFFLKKVYQKFGRLKKAPYLCTTFASTKSRNGQKRSLESFLKKSLSKIW